MSFVGLCVRSARRSVVGVTLKLSPHQKQRLLVSSTSEQSTTTTAAVSTTTATPNEAESVLLSGSASQSLGNIVRHGSGDACIVLNVGGTEFTTLRSTVAANPVLSDHVARAEANHEMLSSAKGGKLDAVFIDRDAKHFSFILQYLRNHVELQNSGLPSSQLSCSPSDAALGSTTVRVKRLIGSWKTQSFMPRIPKDPKVLAELYVEATYYRITELQNALHDQSFWTKMVDFLGLSKVGGIQGNPFVRASQVLTQLRVALVTFTSVVTGTVTVGMATGNKQLDQVMEYLGFAANPDQDAKKELAAPDKAQ